ncbi:MAG: hypothetical protein ACK4RW_01675 [Rehaibacterium terrae]|uniref:hypothetical protein n=1 Tax=Rehaibacterium terrae TaxID=1341696 RepID=UPI003919CCF9
MRGMTMWRRGVALLALAWSFSLAAETVVPLQIGGAELKFAVGEGYLRSSEAAPELHATMAAALPPENRLVEAFITEGDLRRQALGLPGELAVFQVQVLRHVEALGVSEADWQRVRPELARSFGMIDVDALARTTGDEASQRMSEATGVAVGVRFGEIGKPQPYGDDPRSLRFVLRMPVTAAVAGQTQQMTLQLAGAVAHIGGRLVFVYAILPDAGGEDASRVRAALDGFVDRALALNAAS